MASNKVKAVTVLRSDSDFGGEPDTIVGKSKTKKSKKKKQTVGMVEKPLFDVVKQFDKATTAYREGHEKSNAKKQDGWIKDLPKNTTKALGKFKIPFNPF